MSDIWEDPKTKEWVQHCLDDLAPMIEGSAVTVSIVPTTGTDVKFAVELGMSIMYDKPIILLVQPGSTVPDHLRRVADDIVEFDPAKPSAVPYAIDRALQRLGVRP